MKRAFILLLFVLLSGMMPLSRASIETQFERIKSDPNALYRFFKRMPKGGELHYHLAGGAYPETMLALAATTNYCLTPKNDTVTATAIPCDGIPTNTLFTQPKLYNHLIKAWSMKSFIPGRESGHDHFFAAFEKFLPIVADFRPELLASIINRAAAQHELYLEIMILPDNATSASFGAMINGPIGFSAKQTRLLEHQPFQSNIVHTLTETQRIADQARHILGCDTLPEKRECTLTVKFQYYVLREQPLDNFFAQALNGFSAASQSSDLVGINVVQAEDGLIALRDYKEQMRILKFLHQAYPGVHISLHAGELAPSDVEPADLRFHIHDALFTGHASRIGHGVSIAYENKAEALLNHMAKASIPVEINLTSNQAILQITGRDHPIKDYLMHNVPVVLSTDDEGILRTDLSREYVKAVIDHHLDYRTLKLINENALTYSFLPGKSLWTNPKKHLVVHECQNFHSVTCLQFIQNNEKAKLQWELEQQLNAFEAQFEHHTHSE